MQVNKNQLLSLLSIFSFFLLMRTALILYFVEPVGYVTDIYSMFPLSFYIGLILCYFIATYLVLNGKKIIGTLILCTNHLEILLIPYMLKYYSMGRADDMTYIGEYLQIANSGRIADWDIYPTSHIIGSGISIISNMEPHLVSFIIPILFSFIFIAGSYLFSKKLFPESDIKSLVIVSSFILYLGIYNVLNVPHALFFAFMPFYLYVINSYISNKSNSLPFSITFILITLMLPFSHPFIVFFSIIIFVYHAYINNFFTRSNKKSLFPKLKLNSLLVLMISFLSWFIYQGRLLNDLARSINVYINQIGRDPNVIWTAEKMSKINLSFFDYAQLLSFYYGRFIIPTFFIVICFVLIFRNKKIINQNYLKIYKSLLSLYIVFALIQLTFLLNPIIVHQPDRIMNLNFVVYAQIPLFAISLYVIFLNKNKSINNILLICFILTSIWTLSFFGVFDSEKVYRPNVALTYNEVEGMNWFADFHGNYPVSMMFEQSYRYPDILGFERSDWIYIKTMPDHFGYDSNAKKISEVYLDPTNKYDYLSITTLGELLYQELPGHKKVGRFRKEDFETLRNDASVSKVYDSLNIELYVVSM